MVSELGLVRIAFIDLIYGWLVVAGLAFTLVFYYLGFSLDVLNVGFALLMWVSFWILACGLFV